MLNRHFSKDNIVSQWIHEKNYKIKISSVIVKRIQIKVTNKISNNTSKKDYVQKSGNKHGQECGDSCSVTNPRHLIIFPTTSSGKVRGNAEL